MNCPSCGGPLRLEDGKHHLSCDYCKRLHFPEPNADGVRVLEEPAAFNCPVCATALTHAAVLRHRLFCCEYCRGLLIPMEVFVQVIPELRDRHAGQSEPMSPLNARELDRAVNCPKCHRRMDTHPYAGPGNIVIDNCAECRLNWLDYRELRRISRAPDLWSGPGSWKFD